METVAEYQARVARKREAVATVLTADDIFAIRRKGERAKSTRRTKHYYLTRISGTLERVNGKPPTDSIGKYEGNQARKRRSRKGRVSPVPGSGHRYYVAPYGDEVVMY